MPPYQPLKRTSHGGVPYSTVCIYPCLRAAEDILSMSSHEPYGAPASCLRCFALKKKKNTVCTSCFHSLRVVLDTKCCTAPALSCTRIPMRHTSLCDCRTLLLHRLPCISFTINLRKSLSIYFSTKKFSSPIETLCVIFPASCTIKTVYYKAWTHGVTILAKRQYVWLGIYSSAYC